MPWTLRALSWECFILKKLLLIVNPCAGQRKGRRYLTDIIALFNQAGYSVMTHITSHPGEGETVCLQLAQQADLVVCCGGDGTFNEVVSAMVKSGAEKPIGYIPAGSTNDFATSLHLSKNIMQAARDILQGTAEPVDVGCFGGRYFSYVASFGAFTRTSYLTPQNAKNLLGHAAYVLGGIQELSQLRPWAMRFALPDGRVIEDEFVFGAISNSTSVGGVLTLAENLVDLRDGKLEVLLIRMPKDLIELAECVRALMEQNYDDPMLTFLQTSQIEVTAPAQLDWTLDGEREPGHDGPVQIECVEKGIKIIRSCGIDSAGKS